MSRLLQRAQAIAGKGRSVKEEHLSEAAKELGLSPEERAQFEAEAGIKTHHSNASRSGKALITSGGPRSLFRG